MLRIFCLTAAVYVLVRVLYVAALGDVFLYGEELEKGAVALAIQSRVDVPYARLPFHPYEGGGFVASHLKLLVFSVFGPGVLAHKAAAIGWGVLLVAASVGMLVRSGVSAVHPRAGAAAATVGGLLLALGPAHFQKQSLLHLGIHYEALLFIAIVFALGLRVAGTPRGERVPAGVLLALGFASGFGTYFSYQVPIAVLAVIAMLAASDWRRIFAPPLVIATLAGLVPLALMFASVGSEIVDIHGTEVGEDGGWTRLGLALRAGAQLPLAVGAVIFGAIAVLAGLRFERPAGERRRAMALFAGYCVLWTVFAGVTGLVQKVGPDPHWVRFIRFAPLVFTLLMLVAVAVGPALGAGGEARRGASAKIARSAVAILVAIGAVHLAKGVDAGDLGSARTNLASLQTLHGYELRGALIKIAPRLERADDSALERARAIAPFAALPAPPLGPSPELLASDLASALAQDIGDIGPEELLEAIALATEEVTGEPAAVDALAKGLGPVVYRSVGSDVRGALMNPDFDPRFAEALGRYGSGFLSLPPYVQSELATARDTPHGAAFLHGLGRRIFRCGVYQPYWGAENVLNPAALRARALEVAAEAGASEAETAALLGGIDAAARDFGVPSMTRQVGSPTLPE